MAVNKGFPEGTNPAACCLGNLIIIISIHVEDNGGKIRK